MNSLKQFLLLSIATCFGLGYFPYAPGTAGALLGVLIFAVIMVIAPAALQTWLLAIAFLLTSLVTMWLSPWSEKYWGEKDPQRFVTDEVAGFLLTVLLFRLPSIGLTILLAFPVTRAIDIAKVPPAKRLEQLPGGWGILMDDFSASLYAAGLLHCVAFLFLPSSA